MKRMKIGIIGAGNMGKAFAKRLAATGHDVAISAPTLDHAKAVEGGSIRAVPLGEVAVGADLLILATPYSAATEALRNAGDVSGKTIIDITNPLTPDMSGLMVGYTTSAAEEIQKAVPGAYVVKAFNTVFAQIVGTEGTKAQVVFAGDHAGAKAAVRSLIESAGFEALDAGPLAHARYLEPIGMLNIYLGYVAGKGTGIAPAWLTYV